VRRFSAMNTFSSVCSIGNKEYTLDNLGLVLGIILIIMILLVIILKYVEVFICRYRFKYLNMGDNREVYLFVIILLYVVATTNQDG